MWDECICLCCVYARTVPVREICAKYLCVFVLMLVYFVFCTISVRVGREHGIVYEFILRHRNRRRAPLARIEIFSWIFDETEIELFGKLRFCRFTSPCARGKFKLTATPPI